MIEITKIKTKKGHTLALLVGDGRHRPKLFFDKDLICAMLRIDYKQYWEIVKSDDPFDIYQYEMI